MSADSSAPRFDPGARASGQAIDGRRRVLVLGALAVLVALAGASVANAQRASLRCEEGRLVPYGGRLLPLGEVPLDDGELLPLAVPPSECEDEQFESYAELRERYRELATGWVDAALSTEEPSALEASLEALEGLDDGGGLALRYRQVMETLLRIEVEQAHESLERARRRLEQAREAGVDAKAIRSAERSLDAMAPTRPTTSPPSSPSSPAAPEPDAPPSPAASVSIPEGSPTTARPL